MNENEHNTDPVTDSGAQQAAFSLSLDTGVLSQLAEDVSVELMPELIAAFLTELDTRLATVQRTSLNTGEQQIRSQIHSIKSCAQTFGVTLLANKAAKIEQMIDTQANDVESHILQMLALLPAIRVAFSCYQSKLQPD